MTPLFLVWTPGLRGPSPSLVYEKPGSSQETKGQERRALGVRELNEQDMQQVSTRPGETLLDALARMFPFEERAT